VRVVATHYWALKLVLEVLGATLVLAEKVAIVIIMQTLRLVLAAAAAAAMLSMPVVVELDYLVKEHRVRQETRVLLVVAEAVLYMAAEERA
jgi:hypothetical protein